MIKITIGTATLALACSLAIGANAQLVTIKQLSLPIAATIGTTAMETCKATIPARTPWRTRCARP
jgi:hypothetical protein